MMTAEWENEIRSLLDRFHESAAKANFEQYFSCFNQNGCFIGTDEKENWTVEEYKIFCRPHFQSNSAWVYIPIAGKRSLFPFYQNQELSQLRPNFVSFDELLKSKSLKCELRGSGTIIWNEENAKWEILSYYLSFPIPDAVGTRVGQLINDHYLTPPPSLSSAAGAASAKISSKPQIDMSKLEADAEAAAAALLAELDLEAKTSSSGKKKSNKQQQQPKKKGKGKR